MTTALITGANKGIGLATARALAELGWTVWLGSRDLDRGRAAAAQLSDAGHDVRPVQLDVTDDASVDAAVAALGDGPLDVLVNNAGIVGASATHPADTAPQDFLGCFGVNLLGPVRMTRAALPLLRRAEDPRVVMVSSGMGSLAVTTDPDRIESTFHSLIYPSSKAALNMVTTQYAKAIPEVRFTAVDPGYTATDLNGHQGHQTVEEGAAAVIAAATAAAGSPSGTFVARHGPVPW